MDSNQMYNNQSMQEAVMTYKRAIKNYVHDFEDTHCRVHFCHKGPFVCPICPAIRAGEDCYGDLEWLLARLKKKYSLEVYRKLKKNGTWSWNIRKI